MLTGLQFFTLFWKNMVPTGAIFASSETYYLGGHFQ